MIGAKSGFVSAVVQFEVRHSYRVTYFTDRQLRRWLAHGRVARATRRARDQRFH